MDYRTIFLRGIIVALVFLSSGCSEKIDVPAGKIGLLVRFGEVKSHVIGPSSIDKGVLFDSVVQIDKETKINVGDLAVTYVVEDAAAYFYYFRGEPETLAKILAMEFTKNRSESESVVLKRFVKRIGSPVRIVEIKPRK